MKRIFFTLLCGIVMTAGAFANETKVATAVRSSFETEFAGAENVAWSERSGFTVAEFTLNKKPLTAYYESDGDLVVVAQQIMESELPKGLQKEISTKYADSFVSIAFKMTDKDGVKYVATIRKGNKEIILEARETSWKEMSARSL